MIESCGLKHAGSGIKLLDAGNIADSKCSQQLEGCLVLRRTGNPDQVEPLIQTKAGAKHRRKRHFLVLRGIND